MEQPVCYLMHDDMNFDANHHISNFNGIDRYLQCEFITGIWTMTSHRVPNSGLLGPSLLLHRLIYGAVCGFGIIGNTSLFAVLHLDYKINVIDNAFLAVAAFVQIYPAMVVYFGQSHLILPVFYYFRTIAWPLTHTVQLGTVWVMVLVAANRYIAVCKPLHAARLCSMRNVRCQTVVLLICVVLFNIPRIVEYRYVNVNVTSAGNGSSFELAEVNVGLASYPIYCILYENVAYCLFAYT